MPGQSRVPDSFEKNGKWYVRVGDKIYFLGKYIPENLTKAYRQGAIGALKSRGELHWPDGLALPEQWKENLKYQNPIQYQGVRATCACFALTAAIEGVLLRGGVAPINLSEQFANWIFMRHISPNSLCEAGIPLVTGAELLSAYPICAEAEQPYLDEPQIGPLTSCSPGASARRNAKYRIAKMTLIPGPKAGATDMTTADIPLLKRFLAQGYNIAISTRQEWARKFALKNPPVHDVADEDAHFAPGEIPQDDTINHAMLMVGYAVDQGVRYFICKDSRSNNSAYATNDYYYLSERFVAAYVNYGIVVEWAWNGDQLVAPPPNPLVPLV